MFGRKTTSSPIAGSSAQSWKAQAMPLHVGEPADQHRTDAAHAEGEAEEQAGDHADPARQQLLGVDDDRREGRGHGQADQHRQHIGPEQVDERQRQAQRQDTQDRDPQDRLAADPVADRAADQRADRHGTQEQEQVDLGTADRDREPVDQEEGVVGGERRHVEILGEGQRQQDHHRRDHPVAPHRRQVAARPYRSAAAAPDDRGTRRPTRLRITMPITAASANQAM